MSDHEDKGASQLAPIKKPDPDKQFQLQIMVGLAALTLAQAVSSGDAFGLFIGLTLALDAWRLRRKMSSD